MLGYNNQYVGEAFLSFKDIAETNKPLNELPQVHLKLGRPTSLGKHLRIFIIPNIKTIIYIF